MSILYPKSRIVIELQREIPVCCARSQQGLGQDAPTRALRKLARVWEVKSRWSTRFLRIENLWPRDDSCSHTFTLFALFFLESPSLLKPRRMNSQNIISGILAQFRSLPNNPVGRSCWWLPTMRRFLSSILIFPEMWYAHGYWSQTNVPYCCWNAWSTRSNDMPA